MEEIAEVYARSLFEVASEHDRLEAIHDQLDAVADVVSANRDTQLFFFSPYFSAQEKKEGLHRAITDADPIMVNFLEALIERGRMPALFRIRTRFDALWDKLNRRLPVSIVTAVPLDEATVQSIGRRIGEQTGEQIELSSTVDPEIVGGIVLRVGNRIMDASVKAQLDNLRKQVAAQ
ncbi:MAG TPA: ATP synthase F1 subunit delta [Solirubrobacteraceae bacterium]|nr:ATP synthase F1 subunit delta [Solirubrobacteraceae bacterium]